MDPNTRATCLNHGEGLGEAAEGAEVGLSRLPDRISWDYFYITWILWQWPLHGTWEIQMASLEVSGFDYLLIF